MATRHEVAALPGMSAHASARTTGRAAAPAPGPDVRAFERQRDRMCGRSREPASAGGRAPEDDRGAVRRGRRAPAAARRAVDGDDVSTRVGGEDAAARLDERAEVLDLPAQAVE